MEKPNSENPEQLMSDTSDHQDQQTGGGANQSSARSYECTFCKRGFSNAQALGGHMNIHRRDKAKLKQAHETKQHQHQYSSEISKMRIPSYSSPDDPPLYMNPNWFCDQEEESGKGLSSAGRGTSSESEKLDLELRLGPEPPAHDQDSSSSATATRKFF